MTLATKARRTTSHHKKRTGKHHRHSDHYMKTYWPYLPMLLIVAMGIIANSLWSRPNVLGDTSNLSSQALLEETNARRVAGHETGLMLNDKLTTAAQAKANDMAQKDYWSHNSPDGRTPWSFITNAGYHYQVAGENLAYGFANAEGAVAGWMNSPLHRENIMNGNYKDVGFGVAQSQNYQGQGPETIVVAEYGGPVEAATAAGGTAGAQDLDLLTSAKPVSRIQLLSGGQAAWSTAAVSALAGAVITLFILRHGLRLKRLMLEGERFVTHHPLLDISLVFVGTLTIIFMQASGAIH